MSWYQYLLSACKRGAECMESRGPDKKVEYGAYEARSFCEMLLKGSVIILEVSQCNFLLITDFHIFFLVFAWFLVIKSHFLNARKGAYFSFF